MSVGWQIGLAVLGIAATFIGGPLVTGFVQAWLARTSVSVAAKRGMFPRAFSGQPFDAVQVVVANHSPHDVQINNIGLQYYRLWPWPHWKTFVLLGQSYFKHIVPAHQDDDSYFEVSAGLGQHAGDNGWHRGPRMLRAKVEVATIKPRYSSPTFGRQFGQ